MSTDSSQTAENRRDTRRIPVDGVVVEIARIDEAGDIQMDEGQSNCLDLSEGGMQLVTDRNLAPGRRYGFRVMSPALEKPNWFVGKVRWGTETEDGRVRAGVAFEPMEPEDSAVLTTLLHQHSRAVVF